MAPGLRRLAAILIADVVGYARLMERDEAGTHARVRELRERLLEPSIAEAHGRIVTTAGDGLLIEFGSAAAALRCAIRVQRTMLARNESVAADERIQLRIGINLADVIVDGDDIAGDGVNVAARLEALAEPGGICVSNAVREQVHGDSEVAFVDIGEHRVKNLSRAIHVHRVVLPHARTPVDAPRSRWPARLRSGRPVFVASAAISAAIALGHLLPAATGTVASITHPPIASTAVMPFVPATNDADDVELAQRITQDLTTAMQHAMRPARVVSHGTAVRHAAKFVDAQQAGRALNVRYIVEGSLDEASGARVISARLVDTDGGVQLWSDRLAPVAAGRNPDVLVAQLANRIRPAIGLAEAKRAAESPGSSSSAMSLVLRANDAWNQDHSVEGTLAARKAYENVLRIDPAFAPALIGLGYTYQMQLANAREPGRERENLLREMDDVSNRAIRADRDDPRAWSLRSDALALQGRWNAAFEANAQALALDPHQVDALHSRAALLIRTGDPQQALPWLDQAIALSPRGRDLYTSLLYQCRARLALGQLGEAIGACERALALDGTWWYPHLLLLSAYALSGDMPRAAIERARLLEKQPGMSIARFRSHKVSNDPAYLRQTEAYVIAGLRSAGIPED